jgi:L-aspartate oxidase
MKGVIVVGSGIAGLIAALELSRKYRVTLVTKAELVESNTRYAQGGIAAAMADDDTVAEHVADTLVAGAGLNCRAAVEVLCAEGPDRIRDLIRLGVEFDRKNGELARGMEAAHSHARVLHAGGDATGYAIEAALVRAVREASVEVMEHTFARDLMVERGRVVGLSVLDGNGVVRELEAEAVVLASGGAGQMFPHTTNPSVATGDGVAMALRAGAQVADVEFYQFHPTALAVGGNFLVSEAVRGDGAVLRDADGQRFMIEIDPRGELAPRDVVSRGIAAQMFKQGGKPVWLDATAMGAEFLAQRFPTIDKASKSYGFDWGKEWIPVTPAAHYWMGGIRTDLWGRTSLPGLFAVGETACTGVHGANRLASNSLLESLVFAWRCAEVLLDGRGEAAGDFGCSATDDLRAAVIDQTDAAAVVSRGDLQDVMWREVGIFRDAEGLGRAATALAGWKGAGGSVAALEDANLLTIARVMVAAATARRESRGAHYREDFSETEVAFAHSLCYAKEVPVLC